MTDPDLEHLAAEVDDACTEVLRELIAPDLRALAERDLASPDRPTAEEIIAKLHANGIDDPAEQ